MDKYRLSITVTVLALVVSLAVLVPNSTFIKPVNHITITSTVTKTITITYTPQANGNLTLTNQYPSFTLPQLVQSIPEGTGNYRRNTVMFEGNPNHNYVVPTRTGYFIVNLTWGVVVPPGIYDDLLIVTTSGPYNFSISSFPYNIG
ncbi:MAG: pyrrolo-quinoline quinone, partial [Caldivirga sp.]|nr:pyrrolo-quinoline quinone [Caldivirga sp.]